MACDFRTSAPSRSQVVAAGPQSVALGLQAVAGARLSPQQHIPGLRGPGQLVMALLVGEEHQSTQCLGTCEQQECMDQAQVRHSMRLPGGVLDNN